jgi:secreted trypsin-like serine protease
MGLMNDPDNIDIVLGVNNLSDGPNSGVLGQRIGVDRVVPYSGYNENISDADLALLHLETPASLTPTTVSTISLATAADSDLFAPGDLAIVTGWGATSEGGTRSDALLEVDVPIVSNTICNVSYGGDITNNMLCAGLAAGGKDSCQGDSGGPLIVPNGSGGWLQAGIVSWGEGCARPNYYGVYSRVSNFTDWIDGNLNPYAGPFPYQIYLPLLVKSVPACTPAAPGESSNISNALTVCSGQIVSGSVNESNDWDAVYKITVASGERLTITMNGSGGNAELWLFQPGSTNVYSDYPSAWSENTGSNELIDVIIFNGGTWYIDVWSYSGSTNYNLTLNISTP